MVRSITCLLIVGSLAGCDLAGTTASTAAGASAEVEQAKQAKKIEDQVRDQVQLDVQQSRARMEQAEKDAR
jgi:hypothetical protein